MQITRTPEGERLLLRLEGRLDSAWSDHTGSALAHAIAEGWHEIALDLSGVPFLSSAGIRVLVIYYKQLTKISGLLSIVCPSPEVRTVLEMAGLGMMIEPAAAPTPEAAPATAERETYEGIAYEAHPLCAGATLAVEMLEGSRPGHEPRLPFPAGRFGLGLGALAGESRSDGQDFSGRYGEAMALGGVAFAQPADGCHSVDYLLAQGALVPEIMLRSGIVATGDFAELLRFDARDAGGSAPLSTLLALVLKRTGEKAAGFGLLAETEALVGASLLAPPDAVAGVRLAFPEVRDQLRFTAEPAWRHTISLVTGFVAPSGETPLAPLVRPLARGAGPQGHLHATVFPYRPLPKGLIDLPATLRQMLDDDSPLELLHLVNDWREPGGIGESRFRRGALWLAPISQANAL